LVPALGVLMLTATISFAGSDADALRALHEKVMQAHRKSDVALLMEDDAPDAVQANKGVISHPSLEERRERFRAYLGSTRFDVYRDVADPVVRVSDDGTLGWVIVQVEARGVQTQADGRTEPLQFTSAWIELYEKRGGRWVRTGNVSNFKP
jgi:hypothetical protein